MLGPQPSNRNSPGTPLFSAPECVHGYGGIESDIWSAGVLLYSLLSGGGLCQPWVAPWVPPSAKELGVPALPA